jgi:ribosomal protein L6P/L9E
MKIKKTLILHKLKNNKFIQNNFLIEKKDNSNTAYPYVSISVSGPRNILSFYFNTILPLIFLSKNLLFMQNIFKKNTALNIFTKNMKNILKGSNQMFFLEFRIIGLGYKIYKFRRSLNSRIIVMKLGYSHIIKYLIPQNLHVITGKRRLLIYSNDFQSLRMVYKHFKLLKKPNVYKLKGLVAVKEEIKLKQGKQQKR